RAVTDLTYESRTFRHGRPDSLAALVEVVAAGSAGASVVLVPDVTDAAELTDALADEWVTHLLSDEAGLGVIDPGPLEGLQAVVVDDDAEPGDGWLQVANVIGVAALVSHPRYGARGQQR